VASGTDRGCPEGTDGALYPVTAAKEIGTWLPV
jgi:hypothetical protein